MHVCVPVYAGGIKMDAEAELLNDYLFPSCSPNRVMHCNELAILLDKNGDQREANICQLICLLS